MTRSELPYSLGIDAGGTRTRCVLVGPDGAIVARGAAGAANHRTSGEGAAVAAVRASVREVLRAAGHDTGGPVRLQAVGLGWSGLESPGDPERARTIVGPVIEAARYVLDSDVVAAHVGAHRGGPGVLVEAGTGSIVLGVTQDGTRTRVGGWGHRFGDEGGGAWIATEGIRAALRSIDGRGPTTRLWSALRSHCGVPPRGGDEDVLSLGAPESERIARRVTDWLYAPDRHLAEIAAFSELVHACARDGDPVAEAVLERAGVELARMAGPAVTAVARTLADAVPIVGVGGVWDGSETVRAACRAKLRELGPEAKWREPAVDPAVGAAWMAWPPLVQAI